MVVNVCQLSTQTQAKEEIYKKWKSKYEDEITKIDQKENNCSKYVSNNII